MSGWAQGTRNRPDPVDAASCRVRKEGQNHVWTRHPCRVMRGASNPERAWSVPRSS